MNGKDALGLPLEQLARSAIARLHEVREEFALELEHLGPEFRPQQAAYTPAYLQRQLDRITGAIEDAIDRLPMRAAAVAEDEYDTLRAKMRYEVVAAFGGTRPLKGRTIQSVTATWLAELESLEVRLDRQRNILAGDAARLGAGLADAAAKVLDIKIADPRPVPEKDPRGYFGGLTTNYGAVVADQIGAQLELARTGEVPARTAQIRIANLINKPEWRAVTIMRTEIGRTTQEATQERLTSVSRGIQGVEKAWASLLSPTRSRWGHIEAHGQQVPVDRPFLVRPTQDKPFERLMYPKDPSGSPGNTINCFCKSIPKLDNVSVRPSSVAA
jgi:hypothetical protein